MRSEIFQGFKADRLKIFERYKRNGDETSVEEEYSGDSQSVKTIDPWLLDELGNNFSGNQIIFKVIAKDHDITDMNFGGGFQTFQNLGYSDTDKLGKMYTLLMIDIQLPRTKMISKITKYNF